MQIGQFLYVFIGAAIAIVLGNSLYYSILSIVDNVLLPTIIKFLDWVGIDTSDWEYRDYRWIEFIGDFMTFSLAVLLSYMLWLQFRKGTELMNKVR